ncbi:hypothetical protein BU15DRAFT_86849 [Melanogaster broomeanus]|nr:hypothetical protein BU15DRAFT_86849 [Melanogaster broomeanus]
MDDGLEIPRPQLPTAQMREEEDQSSGDEDGGLDWTKLPKIGAAARPVIPKRGEKDFEPAQGGGSGLQLHVLDRSRDAMFEALRAGRSISSKSISYGIWYPSIDPRGIHFSTMGHSVARAVPSERMGDKMTAAQSSSVPASKLPKRLELLPEEALYLVERGALFCYKSISQEPSFLDSPNPEMSSPGAPMSVQQAFAEMIGREGMTLERYQVYAYLKRLGFVLMRAEPPTPEYPVAPPTSPRSSWSLNQPQTILHKLVMLFSRFALKVLSVFNVSRRRDWWKHLYLGRYRTSADIYKALRFIPCGYSLPLRCPSAHESKPTPLLRPLSPPSSPYKVFFHAYKPSTPFRKTAPTSPDFYVVVVNARTTPMPSLQELTALFEILPEMPLPPPRKRGPYTPSTSTQPMSAPTFLQRLLLFLLPLRTATSAQTIKPVPRPPNPFLALKTGKKIVVIAAG